MSCLCPLTADALSTVLATHNWQAAFEALLPAIRSQARFALRHLFGDAQREALQEVVATACVAFARLHQQGRAEVASATSLVRFAVRRYRVGRRVAERTNSEDVTSPACRWQKCARVESLRQRDHTECVWEDVLVEDSRVTPADLAASRLDFPAFLATLDDRRRQIAEVLASGETTLDTAQVFGLSPGRISQLRLEFKRGWDRFVGNVTREPAAV